MEPKEDNYSPILSNQPQPSTSTATRPQTLVQQTLQPTLNQQIIAQALNSVINENDDQQNVQTIPLQSNFDTVTPTDTETNPINQTNGPQSPVDQEVVTSPPREIPLEKKKTKDGETQTHTPGFRHLAEFIFSAEFQYNLANARYIYSEEQYKQITDEPQRNRDWFLHVMDRFPGLLADGGPYLGNISARQLTTV